MDFLECICTFGITCSLVSVSTSKSITKSSGVTLRRISLRTMICKAFGRWPRSISMVCIRWERWWSIIAGCVSPPNRLFLVSFLFLFLRSVRTRINITKTEREKQPPQKMFFSPRRKRTLICLFLLGFSLFFSHEKNSPSH